MAAPGKPTREHAHDHAHEELGFLWKYVFSQDHKVIGIQYAITGLLFLLFGLLRTGQVKLRKMDGWQEMAAIKQAA